MKQVRYVFCLALATLFSVVTFSSAASAATIRCQSEGFEYTRCPADTRGGVQLMQQLSDTQCREGQNWGYDNRGIWVDKGCAGEFQFGRQSTSSDYRRGYVGRSSTGQTIRCESDTFDYKHCPADTSGGVQLTEQLSDTRCREGQNWGYDRRGIWVDEGCAGEFQIGRQTAGRASERALGYSRGYAPYPTGQTVRCESESFGYNRCPADTRGGVQLTEQLSDTQCREGQNWGYDRRGIWVDEGCSGEFLLSRR